MKDFQLKHFNQESRNNMTNDPTKTTITTTKTDCLLFKTKLWCFSFISKGFHLQPHSKETVQHKVEQSECAKDVKITKRRDYKCSPEGVQD